MTVHPAAQEDLAWIQERATSGLSSKSTGIKVVDGPHASGPIRGMVAYDGWTKTSAVCHMAVDTPIAWRRLLPGAFRYPFKQLGRKVLLGSIAANNIASLEVALRLGFSEVHRVAEGWDDGVDLIIVEMRRESCRWLT